MKKWRIYFMFVIGAVYMLLLQTGFWYNSEFSLHFPINIVNHTKESYLIKPLLNIITISSSNTSKQGTTFGKVSSPFNDKIFNYNLSDNQKELNLISHYVNQDKLPDRYENLYDDKFKINLKIPVQYLKDQKLLIISYFRSGSSFLGDLLQQQFDTFYTYEPFIYSSKSSRLNDNQIDEAVDTLDNIFNCRFNHVSKYLDWVKQYPYLLHWNRYLWRYCTMVSTNICLRPSYLNRICRTSKNKLIKTNRFKFSFVEKLIYQFQNVDNLKIIYLVRDPRAIYNSRKSLFWCANSTCTDMEYFCKEMEEDVHEFKQLSQNYPDLIIPIRFEELSLDPYNKTKELFEKLKRPMTRSIQFFLRLHVKKLAIEPKNIDPYSTHRDSQKVPLNWYYQLSYEEIKQIQIKCESIMKTLGYKPVDINNAGKVKVNASTVITDSFPLEDYILSLSAD